MDAILQWGAGVIAAVQSLRSPALDAAVIGFTQLGSEYFFLAALPILFWCVDERRGVRLGFLTFFTLFANLALKDLIALQRPYQVRPELHVIDEVGGSLPSWHAQGSAVFWGSMVDWIKKPWGIVLAFAMPLAIGFTRIYLGVHYPTDVLAGWALGAAFVIAYRALEPKLLPIIGKLHTRFQIAIVAGISWVMCAVHLKDVAPGAAFFGIGMGYALNLRHLRFSAAGKAGSRILRAFAGGVPLAALYFGIKLVSPVEGQANYALFRFIRYGILGFWVAFGAPWLFQRLKLAGRKPEEKAPAPSPAA